MVAATAMIPTASQIASSKCHLERREDWRYYRVAGIRYIAMLSGRSGKVYRVRADGQGCDCPAYQQRGYSLCSHMLAAREAAQHDAMNEWLADQADDLLFEYDAEQKYRGYQAVLTLARMGGFCVERGCQNDSERGEDFCSAHQLVDVA